MSELGALEQHLVELRLEQDVAGLPRLCHPCLTEIGPASARAACRATVAVQQEYIEVGAAKRDRTQVRTYQAGAVEVGAGHVGLVQVGAVEHRETQVATAQVERRPARRHLVVD